MRVICILLLLCSICYAAPQKRRSSEALSTRDKEFAERLSARHRRIFCGQFNQTQRDETVKYARGVGQDKCCTPDEAVLKVMEDMGMSLAFKGRIKEPSEEQDK
ncbi:MAG: hypothetical protein JSS30_05405 [Verrucomicrobia bacterium]|nr:hypothetical protein [Verrucomicrobiota bacterium]